MNRTKKIYFKTIEFFQTHFNVFVISFIVLVGVFFRVKLFAANYAFIFDEAALVANIINLETTNIFAPLQYEQVCPPFSLVAFKLLHETTKNILPYEASFRIFPLLCGILSLPLFAYLLNSVSEKKYFVWTGLFLLALNKFAIIYSCTAKQYSAELFFAIFLLMIFFTTDIKRISNKKLVLLSALIAVAPFFSFVGYVIIFAGLTVWFVECYKSKNLKKFFTLAVIPAVSAVFLYFCWFKNVYAAQSDFMFNYWHYINPHFLTVDNFIYTIKLTLINLARLSVSRHWITKTVPFVFFVINFYFVVGVILFIQLIFKKYKIAALTVLPVFMMIIAGFFAYSFVERCILFILPCLLILLSSALIPIKESKYLTVLFLILIVDLVRYSDLNYGYFFNGKLRSLYHVLTDYNPKMTGIIATKSCFTAYSGKTEVLYDLDIWKNFDENEFENFIKSLSPGNYYIYLPYDRYKSDYNEMLAEYIEKSELIKVVKITDYDKKLPEFTAHIVKK